MGEKVQLDEHGWVDRLLPWFVNNTLDESERERVRRHLNSCDACREAATLLSTVQSSVRHAIPMVPPPRTEKLLATIDSFDKKSRRARITAAIGVAASVAAALVVGALLLPDPEQATTVPARYETTTSPTRTSSMDYVLDLEFEPETSRAVQEQVLRGLEPKEINRSGLAGTYRITVSLPVASLEELERYTRDIESLGEIRNVDAVAVQLPMKRPQ